MMIDVQNSFGQIGGKGTKLGIEFDGWPGSNVG